MVREEIFNQIWSEQDQAYELMTEYDSMPHKYREDVVLYQAERELVDAVAMHPNITITELSEILKKTPSACSQLVRKLNVKGCLNINYKSSRLWTIHAAGSTGNLYSL